VDETGRWTRQAGRQTDRQTGERRNAAGETRRGEGESSSRGRQVETRRRHDTMTDGAPLGAKQRRCQLATSSGRALSGSHQALAASERAGTGKAKKGKGKADDKLPAHRKLTHSSWLLFCDSLRAGCLAWASSAHGNLSRAPPLHSSDVHDTRPALCSTL
jgi:hypothetical protein